MFKYYTSFNNFTCTFLLVQELAIGSQRYNGHLIGHSTIKAYTFWIRGVIAANNGRKWPGH